MSKNTPHWLAVDDDGATITLTHPTNLNGVKQNKVRLRAPTIADLRAAKRKFPDDSEGQEIQLFASLAECGFEEIELMRLKDYTRVQAGYFRLVAEGDNAGTAAAGKAPAGLGDSAVGN